MRFWKMHGIGNDFVLVDLWRDASDDDRGEGRRWRDLAPRLCDRHFGVGGDGVLLVLPSEKADVRMRMFNPDGSEAEMCGNGIRCLARYVREHHGVRSETLRVETIPGIMEVSFPGHDASRVQVDMGTPRFAPSHIPIQADGERVVDYPLAVNGRELRITAVSMGNPHAVAFLQDGDLAAFPLEAIGPDVERHPLFPRRTNFEVCQVEGPHRMWVRVWERGAGATLACGTGACAAAVAGVTLGLVESPVQVTLPGGTLEIAWQPGGPVLMTGPASYVFAGEWLAD